MKMAAMGEHDHEGEWLKRQIARKKMSVSAFARKVGVSREALNKWFKQHELRIRPDMLWSVLDALGFESPALKSLPEYGDDPFATFAKVMSVRRAVSEAQKESEAEEAARRQDKIAEALSGGRCAVVKVQPAGSNVAKQVPIINKLAAGHMKEATDLGYPAGYADDYVTVAVGDVPCFGMWIEGDSMSPRYEHGDLVIFRQLDPECDEFILGEDYAIQYDGNGDGESTFKRMRRCDLEKRKLTLEPINPKFKPRKIIVNLDHVIRVGQVMMVIPRLRKGR